MESFKAWQCIGCGRIDGPQNCIGVCRDRKVEFVYASELAVSEARAAVLAEEAAALHAFVRTLAGTTPRDGQWESSYRSMQERARAILARHPAAIAPVADVAAVDATEPGAGSRTREA